MIFTEKWILYALSASMLWGASYAASGPILRSGIPPLLFYFCYSFFSFCLSFIILLAHGKIGTLLEWPRNFGSNAPWFLFSLFAASLAALMTYMAIGEKNASLASLIEISYPLFVILFTWLFFREVELTVMTAAGALLVLSGVSLILWNTR